jgi:flagellar L-ring protein precursor FlgH
MKNVLRTAVVICLAFGIAGAQDMRGSAARSLFSDQKATRIGDAITIIVVESSNASNAAKTTSSRASSLGLTATSKTGASGGVDINGGLGTTNDFKGEGGTSSQGSVTAKLSARVDTVFPNGDLSIVGTRLILINGEEQTIRISGIVRTSDIAPDNSVYSYNIADAHISFEGNGIVSGAQKPGWLTKFFHWIF